MKKIYVQPGCEYVELYCENATMGPNLGTSSQHAGNEDDIATRKRHANVSSIWNTVGEK